MATPQEIQRNARFHQLLFELENLNETLVASSAQLTAIANQCLQIRNHLNQLKATAPSPNPNPVPEIDPKSDNGG